MGTVQGVLKDLEPGEYTYAITARSVGGELTSPIHLSIKHDASEAAAAAGIPWWSSLAVGIVLCCLAACLCRRNGENDKVTMSYKPVPMRSLTESQRLQWVLAPEMDLEASLPVHTDLKTSNEQEAPMDMGLENLPNGVPLVWDTAHGQRTVYATKKPLGVQFRAEFPLKVKREPEGHGKDIGIQMGWILRSVNSIDVTAMTDIGRVNEILYREVGEKTVPLESFKEPAPVALVWDTPHGERTVYATKKPLG